MTKLEECKSHRPNDLVCKSGFVQMPYCSGRTGCHACGHISENALPACLGGDLPNHLFELWESHQ